MSCSGQYWPAGWYGTGTAVPEPKDPAAGRGGEVRPGCLAGRCQGLHHPPGGEEQDGKSGHGGADGGQRAPQQGAERHGQGGGEHGLAGRGPG